MSSYRKIQAEDCPCREGMFPRGKVSRRGLLFAVGSTVGVSSASLVRPAQAAALSAPPGSVHYDVAADPTKEQGRPTFEDGGYGSRSQFETAVRLLAPNPNPNTTFTPLADLLGNITPSGLHFERHHAGIPVIDPAKHSLVIHGLVGTPKRFTMADIRRMPSVTRKHFIECSGNTLSGWTGQMEKTVQASHGLLSTSEWTGVLFSEFAKQVGRLQHQRRYNNTGRFWCADLCIVYTRGRNESGGNDRFTQSDRCARSVDVSHFALGTQCCLDTWRRVLHLRQRFPFLPQALAPRPAGQAERTWHPLRYRA